MTEPVLDVHGACKTFGGLRAVDDVTLQARAGQVTGLIGPNGAGKTTLFNVISGLLPADGGTIGFDGVDVTGWSSARRAAAGMARSFQNLGLIADETVRTNLLAAQFLGAGYRPGDVLVRPWRWRRAERRMHERAEAAAAELGLTEHLDDRIGDLSFGRARFAELACVLLQEPKLMLLDEPTTGLDLGEVRRLATTLRDHRGAGIAMVVVAHDVRFVMQLCDYVYVLASGRLLAQGPPEEIQRNPDVIATYLGRAA